MRERLRKRKKQGRSERVIERQRNESRGREKDIYIYIGRYREN
jgi:hypothetical protein